MNDSDLVPFMKDGEELEFNLQLTQCGTHMAQRTIAEFRQLFPQLKNNPGLEFRIRPSGEWYQIFIRKRDWVNVLVELKRRRRKAGKKEFWRKFPRHVQGVLLAGTFFGAVCVVGAAAISLFIDAKVKYFHVCMWGFGIPVVIMAIFILYDYAIAYRHE